MKHPSYRAIPDISRDAPTWEYDVLSAIKENLEILMGTRVAGMGAATTSVETSPAATMQTQTRITAQGAGYQANSSGNLPASAQVPSLADYVKLATDVQTMMQDLTRVQAVLVALITEFRSY